MKVITKCVIIENEEFYLISDYDNDGHKYYGTIPYSEVKDGKMVRALNGFEIAVADTIAEAIARREHDLIVARKMKEYLAQGMSKEDAAIKAIFG